jgi:toxin ParE1/3/4
MKLRISEPAREDLLEIWQHVASNNPEAAERLMRSFKETFEKLLGFPSLGKERHELAIGIRSFPVGKYIVLYQPADEVLEIVRVRHGATKMDDLFTIE